MAEIKNTFIKSKMNKDLDDRLIPKGEYRDGLNIAISQTEGADVGALHAVIGNVKKFEIESDLYCGVEIIGKYVDDVNQIVYLFYTNFIDSSATDQMDFSGEQNTSGILSGIAAYNISLNTYSIIVSGSWLNFSLSHSVLNVDLIEDLLFWTDNRNQPRKINVTTATQDPTYYSNEDLISVAKYYPWNPISLVNDEIVDITIIDGGDGTALDPAEWQLGLVYNTSSPEIPLVYPGNGLTLEVTSVDPITGNITGVEVINPGVGYEDGDIVYIESTCTNCGTARVQLTVELISTMKDTCTPQLPPTGVSEGDTVFHPPGNILTLKQPSIPLFTEVSGGVFPYTLSEGELWVYNADKPTAGWQWVYEIDESGGQSFFTPAEANGTPYPVYNATTLVQDYDWEEGDTYYFSLGNPYYNSDWPGDCEYLKDKFVRFAYRFKFNDDEYSLISPFTQVAFQPQQYGYFLYPDTENAYDATDVDFVQNRITEVDLIIPCPDLLENNIQPFWSQVEGLMGVKSIEILYKEDNELTVKVLDTIPAVNFKNNATNKIRYIYQSRAPYRVLPEQELARTSDKVPVRALTQSITGNRVIYSNYLDKHSSIDTLNYQVGIGTKREIPQIKEYYNHTVKQNRTYQVGWLLTDRYGRKSDVILSSLDSSSTNAGAVPLNYRGSTVFHPFSESTTDLITLTNTWPGDQINVLLNQPIPETGPIGYPGIFRSYSRNKNAITNFYAGTPGSYPSSSTPQPFNGLGGSGGGLTLQAKVVGGDFVYDNTSPIVVDFGINYVDGDIITIENPLTPGSGTATFVYRPNIQPNLLGFSSYSVVTKQQEQDYYNVYVPGILNNTVLSFAAASFNTATLSLYGDNINKIPKDLNDAAPTQRGFSSSTFLSLRVENVDDGGFPNNRQFFPGRNLDKVVTLGTLSEFGITNLRPSAPLNGAGVSSATQQLSGFLEDVDTGALVTAVDNSTGVSLIDEQDEIYVLSYYEDSTSTGDSVVVLSESINTLAWVNSGTFTFNPPGTIYKSNENPLLGVLNTKEQLGLTREDGMVPELAIFETKPTYSNLNIFWESTTSGLINDLNFAVVNDDVSILAVSVSDINFDFNEEFATTIPVDVTNLFYPLDGANNPIIDSNTTCVLEPVTDGTNAISTGWTLVSDGAGRFKIQSNEERYCGSNPDLYTYNFTLKFTYGGATLQKQFTGVLSNSKPIFNLDSDTPKTVAIVNGVNPQFYFYQAYRPSTMGGYPENGAGGTTLSTRYNEVKITLVSAEVTAFDDVNWGVWSNPCNCPTATTNPNGGANQAGLYIGMDVKDLFTWVPSTSNYSHMLTLPDASVKPSITYFQDSQLNVLGWKGFSTTNGGPVPQSIYTQGMPVYWQATFYRCKNIELLLTFRVYDGAGATTSYRSLIVKPQLGQN